MENQRNLTKEIRNRVRLKARSLSQRATSKRNTFQNLTNTKNISNIPAILIILIYRYFQRLKCVCDALEHTASSLFLFQNTRPLTYPTRRKTICGL